MNGLTIEAADRGGQILLTLCGILDEATLPQAEGPLSRISGSTDSGVVLNLYECEYIDTVALSRLVEFSRDLSEQSRPIVAYARGASFVAYRAADLPLSDETPPDIVEASEERLARKRLDRLRRWRVEKPIPEVPPPGAPVSLPPPPPASKPMDQAFEAQIGGPDLSPIDFSKVSVLAGKDVRVVQRIWKTYSEFLDEDRFTPAPDGLADTQLAMDAKAVALALRLDSKEVRKVIESVSTYLVEAFDVEED